MSTIHDGLALLDYTLIAIAGAAMLYLFYRHGHYDGRKQSVETLTRLRHQVYKQQTMINEVSAERDMYRSGYESMSKRVDRIGL